MACRKASDHEHIRTASTASRAQKRPMNPTLARRRHAQRELSPPLLMIAAGRPHTAETILRAWFDGKSEHTIRSYRHDLEDFALYFSRALGMSPRMDINESLARLFKQS